MFCLKIINKAEITMAVSRGTDEVNLVYCQEYRPGDKIILEVEKSPCFLWLSWDDAIGSSLVYVTGNISYRIPFDEKRINLSPKAFWGSRHLIRLKKAEAFEVLAYRNLALNVCDQHGLEHCFPHAIANVETRDEAVFAAQNAIDGITINTCHGEWPYQSWGINRQADARIRIEFGREVAVDRIRLYTRADFPHDNWWEKVSFTFSDQSVQDMKIERNCNAHILDFAVKKIHWLEMHDMKISDAPSPFPALTQIEVFGKEDVLKRK